MNRKSDHSHAHSKNHMHEHTHSNSHGDGRPHSDRHADSPGAPLKDLALLRYMLEHNRQHALELAEASGRLSSAGITGAAELISDAVHYFDHANEKLEEAVKLVCGGV